MVDTNELRSDAKWLNGAWKQDYTAFATNELFAAAMLVSGELLNEAADELDALRKRCQQLEGLVCQSRYKIEGDEPCVDLMDMDDLECLDSFGTREAAIDAAILHIWRRAMAKTPNEASKSVYSHTTSQMLMFYGFSHMRTVAVNCGYAIAVHGSLSRDVDLIAIPWTDEAVTAQALVTVLQERLNILGFDCSLRTEDPKDRPHGRKVWSMVLGNGACIDFGVMPRKEASDGE